MAATAPSKVSWKDSDTYAARVSPIASACSHLDPLSHPSSLLLLLLTRQAASTSDQVTSVAWRDCSSSRRTQELPGGAGAPTFASRSFRRALAWRAAGSRECAESEQRRGGGVERAGDIDRASAT